jgi:predicted ATPase
MLTGQLPFTAADPMEWVHCHIARQPAPPNEQIAGIPGPLAAIVMKLLAKTGEERYQTAAGVEADLRRCQGQWEATGRIAPFHLGAHDASDRLLIPEKLYGREREVDALVAAFDRVVAQGSTELMLVSGYSGIGKSSVVNELHKALVPPRGLFASGKFDQYKRDIPYATLAQAFQSLVCSLLSQSGAELGRWRDSLSEALGPNGQLIVNLVPELELVIGKQPPVADLPPQDAQNRFQLVFRRFLGVFARKEHPLALFLDDLQWLDAATLELLEHLVTHPEVRHLLLVGAYRDNEVSPSHPLVRTLDAIRKAGARVQEIVLAPLGLDDVGQLVADALHCEPEDVRPLAQLVQEKTGGNPFFAIQFFTALAEEGLLAFDPITRAWQWGMDRIRAKSHTDNVVDLMAGKLKRLPSTTQEALKQLACWATSPRSPL